MKKKETAFNPIEAQWLVKRMRKCVAIQRNKRYYKCCRWCPEEENGCTSSLLEQAATQLELAIKGTLK